MLAHRVVRFDRRDEVGRDQLRSLVDKLVKRVLAIGARLAPDDGTGGIIDEFALRGSRPSRCSPYPLLEIGGEPVHVLVIGQNGLVCAPKKLLYQTPSMPSTAGRFFSSGVVRKCSSMAWPPSATARNYPCPMKTAIDRPMADHSEYRPPTQSQNSNMFCLIDSEFADFLLVGRERHEMLGHRGFVLGRGRNHSRAVCALVSVSCVVKVFDATMNSVVSGLRIFSVSAICVPSTLETKCTRSPGLP